MRFEVYKLGDSWYWRLIDVEDQPVFTALSKASNTMVGAYFHAVRARRKIRKARVVV